MIAYLYQTSNRESCVSWLRKDDEHIFTYIAQPDKYIKRRDKKKTQVHLSLPSVFGVTVLRRQVMTHAKAQAH